MAVPYTFGTATASIPLSNLDSNFATTITLGNTAIQLGNTVTTLNNMTLANVTVSSGNVTFTNVSATTANVTTANITTAVIGTATITTAGITTANVATGNVTTLVTTSVTNSGLTTGRVVYTTTGGLETSSANLLYSGTDLTVYGLTVGRGAGALSTNTAVGASTLAANTTGDRNTAVGSNALFANTTGFANVAMGYQALKDTTTGAVNTAIGHQALILNTTGDQNTAMGTTAGADNTTGSNNTFIGYQSGYRNTTGVGNQLFGNGSGSGITTGSKNVIIGSYNGNQGGLDIRTANNYVVLSDGDGNVRQTIDSSGNVGIGTTSPAQRLTVKSATNGSQLGIDNAGAQYTSFNIYNNGTNKVGVEYDNTNSHFILNAIAASSQIILRTVDTERMRIDSSGNVGIGVTPKTINNLTGYKALEITSNGASIYAGSNQVLLGSNIYWDGSTPKYSSTSNATFYDQSSGIHSWHIAPSGTAGTTAAFTQAMTLNASGNFLVGTTTNFNSDSSFKQTLESSTHGMGIKTTGSFVSQANWNSVTTGNSTFSEFVTETAYTIRGSITYNRAGGIVVYNTTSDYRAKDISGPVVGSGALIDSVPVYMGKMKDATQERPMFIAHETPAYAHTGEKDAVDADGNPVYQQMDASALIPVMWAELQSLRIRLAALEAA